MSKLPRKVKLIFISTFLFCITSCSSISKNVEGVSINELNEFTNSMDLLLKDKSFLKSEIQKINASKPSVQRIINEADSLWKKGKLENSSKELERALRITRNESSIFLRLSHIRLEQGLKLESEGFAARGLLINGISSWERLLLNAFLQQ